MSMSTRVKKVDTQTYYTFLGICNYEVYICEHDPDNFSLEEITEKVKNLSARSNLPFLRKILARYVYVVIIKTLNCNLASESIIASRNTFFSQGIDFLFSIYDVGEHKMVICSAITDRTNFIYKRYLDILAKYTSKISSNVI